MDALREWWKTPVTIGPLIITIILFKIGEMIGWLIIR